MMSIEIKRAWFRGIVGKRANAAPDDLYLEPLEKQVGLFFDFLDYPASSIVNKIMPLCYSVGHFVSPFSESAPVLYLYVER